MCIISFQAVRRKELIGKEPTTGRRRFFSRSPLNNRNVFRFDRNLILAVFLLLLIEEYISRTHYTNNLPARNSNNNLEEVNQDRNVRNGGLNQLHFPPALSSFSYQLFNDNILQSFSSINNPDDVSLNTMQSTNLIFARILLELIVRGEFGHSDNFNSHRTMRAGPNQNSESDSDSERAPLIHGYNSNASNDDPQIAATVIILSRSSDVSILHLLRNSPFLFHAGARRNNEETVSANSKIVLPEVSRNHKKLDAIKVKDIPEDYICPLSCNVMSDPVFNTALGLPNVERAWILIEIERKGKNPFNNSPLQESDLQSNVKLKEEIDGFVDNLVQAYEQNQLKM